ncbi:probable 4-coumarate--CoA ligase 1 [Folsomia candida]|uniref:probable 4-coumarate--CoA ligase 1 n=1 Tax=Folsomia candida TaxID=158441 RepID=UPI000B8F199F|nr:probable 4-coumarate--CoA ligase 1 [Folsomia candida]
MALLSFSPIIRKFNDPKLLVRSFCSSQILQGSAFRGKWIKSKLPENPNVISSVVEFQASKNLTIPEFLRLNLEKYENHPALECGITGRIYTHGEVYKKGESFATALIHHGLKRGDSVCILLPNIPEYAIVALGIWDAGFIASPINPAYTPAEVARQVENCGGKSIITLSELLPIVEKVKELAPTLKSVIVIGDPKGHHNFFDMLNTEPDRDKLLKGSDIDTETQTALLPYSSGTTGPPKGVELTHSTFSTNLLQALTPGYRQTFYNEGTDGERFIAVLPFFHMYGLQFVLASALHHGAHCVCLPKFDPATFTQTIRRHKPTLLHLVTPLMQFLLHNPDVTKKDLETVKGSVAGGAPTGKTLISRYLEKFDHGMIYQEAYGMTEISSGSHMTPPEVSVTKAGSGGTLLPGTTAKIVDIATGKVVGPNETGEICVRGPQIMKGYYKNEKATKETRDDDGFLKTGDIGYHDDEGFLYIVDRLKELIKVKGLQVAPAELEDILRQHPEIADVAVVGIPHEKLGEAPRAYVVPKTKSLTEKSVSDFMESKVSSHKKLVGGVELVSAIPKAPSGKILRRVLKDEYTSRQK